MAKPGKTAAKKQHSKSPKPKQSTARKQRQGFSWEKWGPWVLLGIVAIILLNARIQLLAIPLERDEGSFAYIGYGLLHGKELYTDMLDSKLPGLYTIYGLSTLLFGYSATGVHTGLFLLSIGSAFFFFLLIRDLFNEYVAAISTALLMILTLSQNVIGFAAHATQLLLPFLLCGCWLFWKGIRERKLWIFFLAGLMIGIAFTIKQQAAIFGLLLALIWWPARLKWNRIENKKFPLVEWLLLGIGGLLPLAMTIAYFGFTGRLDEFISWTFTQPMKLSNAFIRPWYDLLWEGIKTVSKNFELIWLTALFGFVLIFLSGFKKETTWFGFLFSLIGLLSIAIGVGYYLHYFVLALPGVALCTGITIYWLAQKFKGIGKYASFILGVILIIIPLIAQSSYYFNPDHNTIHQKIYGANMFPELEKIGQELGRRTPDGGRIVVLGSEPEVFVAAQREACSRHLMVYAMLIDPATAQAMQDEYFNAVTSCQTDYVVFDVNTSSWAPGFDKIPLYQKIINWLEAGYYLEGIAEYQQGAPGIILWGDAARSHKPQTNAVYVYKKR